MRPSLLSRPLRLLVAESEPRDAREARRRSVGTSSGESFLQTLQQLAPGCDGRRIAPADDDDGGLPRGEDLAAFDAVFLTGSPLHLYKESPEARRQVAFMRAVFEAGTPAFGSCAGLQVATVAAGGRVRPARSHEAGFARRIARTEAGRNHPLLEGRPDAYDALSIHGDEVEVLPDGAVHLARNAATEVQAAEIRCGTHGVFWGVQYHPELDLGEIAQAMRRDADSLVADGLARERGGIEAQADLFDLLHEDAGRSDVAWRMGADVQAVDQELRRTELRNFLHRLVLPRAAERGRSRSLPGG